MNSTVLKEVIAFLFGRKYYANIIATKGTGENRKRRRLHRHRQNRMGGMSDLLTSLTKLSD